MNSTDLFGILSLVFGVVAIVSAGIYLRKGLRLIAAAKKKEDQADARLSEGNAKCVEAFEIKHKIEMFKSQLEVLQAERNNSLSRGLIAWAAGQDAQRTSPQPRIALTARWLDARTTSSREAESRALVAAMVMLDVQDATKTSTTGVPHA